IYSMFDGNDALLESVLSDFAALPDMILSALDQGRNLLTNTGPNRGMLYDQLVKVEEFAVDVFGNLNQQNQTFFVPFRGLAEVFSTIAAHYDAARSRRAERGAA